MRERLESICHDLANLAPPTGRLLETILTKLIVVDRLSRLLRAAGDERSVLVDRLVEWLAGDQDASGRTRLGGRRQQDAISFCRAVEDQCVILREGFCARIVSDANLSLEQVDERCPALGQRLPDRRAGLLEAEVEVPAAANGSDGAFGAVRFTRDDDDFSVRGWLDGGDPERRQKSQHRRAGRGRR